MMSFPFQLMLRKSANRVDVRMPLFEYKALKYSLMASMVASSFFGRFNGGLAKKKSSLIFASSVWNSVYVRCTNASSVST